MSTHDYRRDLDRLERMRRVVRAAVARDLFGTGRRRTDTAGKLAYRFGVSRQRVHQIVQEVRREGQVA